MTLMRCLPRCCDWGLGDVRTVVCWCILVGLFGLGLVGVRWFWLVCLGWVGLGLVGVRWFWLGWVGLCLFSWFVWLRGRLAV